MQKGRHWSDEQRRGHMEAVERAKREGSFSRSLPLNRQPRPQDHKDQAPGQHHSQSEAGEEGGSIRELQEKVWAAMRVVYEDEDIIVVDKTSGILSVPVSARLATLDHLGSPWITLDHLCYLPFPCT